MMIQSFYSKSYNIYTYFTDNKINVIYLHM